MQCWNSVFNAQGSRVIILVVQVGAVQALREKETQDETQFTTKIGGKTNYFGSQSFPFVKFSFPVRRLMPYHAKLAIPAP
jgi:hypothetical protein